MLVDGYHFMLDVAAKFYRNLYLFGWFQHPSDALVGVELETEGLVASWHEVGLPHAGVAASHGQPGWRLQAMLSADQFPGQAHVRFITAGGHVTRASVLELLVERDGHNPSTRVQTAFFERIRGVGYERVLDLGGRDRSSLGIDYIGDRHQVTVFDIVADPGVHVVGDAHELSRHFPAGHFDALHCRCVLEHTLMPWKVAVEAAKVLRLGGVGYFLTHQTTGMHDLPWDYWRFSDSAWDALFNHRTGFRIVDRALAHECYVIPHRWRPDAEHAERAAGFESSTVLVEKIAEPSVDWPVTLSGLVKTAYPAR
jgi:hypothetical protein